MHRLPSPVPPNQRAYVASHPLGLWVSAGIAISGWINLIAPSLTSESVVALIFPQVVLYVFNAVWAVGGTMATGGLLRGKRKVEAAGMTLLASGLGSYFLAVVSVRATSALAAVFIVTLAIGCALRAKHLTSHGYVTLDLPSGQRGMK
jgi:hypothetical protein